jgi:hypothetical protein
MRVGERVENQHTGPQSTGAGFAPRRSLQMKTHSYPLSTARRGIASGDDRMRIIFTADPLIAAPFASVVPYHHVTTSANAG